MPLLLMLLMLITTTPTYSQTSTPPPSQFHEFNVEEAIAGTKLKKPPETPKQAVLTEEEESEGKLKVKLVHRDKIFNSASTLYNHRTRFDARIKRDIKRVSFLLNRLSSNNNKNAEQEGIEDAGFGSDVVSGTEEGSGEYFVRIGVGSPPTYQYVVIDSGSDIVWVQCQPCDQCYNQSDPIFNPDRSASFAGVPCSSAVCDQLDHAPCRQGRCGYEVSYGDGSYTKGTLALETLTLGRTVIRKTAIGCGHWNEGMFVGAAGLLGLGGGPMSFVGQLGAQTEGAFGYCLLSRGGTTESSGSLQFGRQAVPVGAVWVPLVHNPLFPSFYYISLSAFISKAEKHSRKRSSWWQKFFLEDDGNWLGLKDDDMESEAEEESSTEDEKFEAWKQRAEAIVELREAQEDRRNEEYREWEDWLLDQEVDNTSTSSWEQGMKDYREKVRADSGDVADSEKGLVESVRYLIFGRENDDDDMLYEDRVFQYASSNSAKFLAVLIIIPWAIDFLVHDYVLMPFLDRYVKTVPLAAQMLDVRRYQKLKIVEELRTERGRFELEVEIGKSPPLSDDEVWWELRNKALELRDEWRLENRRAFANIWSDTVYGISLFILLYFNKSKVALLKFTGYKIINNISDTGKAFLIILITDIFLGYHSESGWQTLLEIIVEHYGLEVDQSAITIFVCLIPVIFDACVKLWLFKFLPRLSPKVMNIFREMKRH